MSVALVNILGRGQVSEQMQILVSRGIALLLTKPSAVFRKMKLEQELVDSLVGVLKQLVSVESNAQAAFQALESSESMTAKLQSILE